MKKSMIFLLIPIITMSIIISISSSVNSQTKTTIRCASTAQPTMPAVMAGQKFCDLITEKTNGRITMIFYPSRQLGDEAEQIQQVIDGTIEAALPAVSTLTTYSNTFNCLQLPFLLNDYSKIKQISEKQVLLDIFSEAEKYNMKVISLVEYGIRHLANNVRPIQTIDDLKGLKLRVPPSKVLVDTINALGANPIPLAYGEVYSALQNKVIDGEEINLTSFYSEKHYEVTKYFTKIGLWPFPGVIVFNLDYWNSLSNEDQDLMLTCAKEALDYNLMVVEETELRSIKTIQEAGVKINEISDLAPFIKATALVYEKFIEMDPLIKKFVEEAQSLEQQ